LNESKRNAWQRPIPRQRDTGSVNGGNGEKDECGETEYRRDDRREVFSEFEAGEQTPELFALKKLGQEHANCEKDSERNQSGGGDVISADAE
jgi:hypothetical protein